VFGIRGMVRAACAVREAYGIEQGRELKGWESWYGVDIPTRFTRVKLSYINSIRYS